MSGPFKRAAVVAREAQPVSLVLQGRLKHIHENMPKNSIEPSPKFDGHLSKSANRVTSLLSYRAFELTQVSSAPSSDDSKSSPSRFNAVFYFFHFSQQYFFEFAFDEIKARPRHVCPYAVVSFLYKSKEPTVSPMSAHRYRFLRKCGKTLNGQTTVLCWFNLSFVCVLQRFNTPAPEGSKGKTECNSPPLFHINCISCTLFTTLSAKYSDLEYK